MRSTRLESAMNEHLRRQLVAMQDEDLRVRTELAETGELYHGYAPRMAEVHARNAEALEAIIDTHGWPGKTLAGEDGANAAWLVLQHAIGSPALQRKCLPILREAAASGEAEPAHPAYLADRIAFFERRPQRYGTQFDWDDEGRMSPWTIEDPDKVDEYRRSVGLGSLEERIAEVREATQEPRPADTSQRREEMDAWARSVGWIRGRARQ